MPQELLVLVTKSGGRAGLVSAADSAESDTTPPEIRCRKQHFPISFHNISSVSGLR
jgi:hypothetical protein